MLDDFISKGSSTAADGQDDIDEDDDIYRQY